MDVYDEAELYETGDIVRAARNFGLMEAINKDPWWLAEGSCGKERL